MSGMSGAKMGSGGSTAFNPNLDPGESVTVSITPALVTSSATYDQSQVTHHEFQANCVPNHTANDDPILFPGQSGASHNHTFMGSTETNAMSTTASLKTMATSCNIPDDHSAYWFPTLYSGDTPIVSDEAQTIYYKSGITDYRGVRPFPSGLRFIVGDMKATADEFQNARGTVIGYECGNVDHKFDFGDFPAACASGNQLDIRYQAPSCWDGVNLDSADHKSHMAYPVLSKNSWVCPADHPVAVPMLEFKMHFPLTAVKGDISELSLASGAGSSWHYDFFNSWEPKTLAAMVAHCITGGLQCDTYGNDLYKPSRGRVLDANHHLLASVPDLPASMTTPVAAPTPTATSAPTATATPSVTPTATASPTTGSATPVLVSQGRPATASSTEGVAWAAKNAVDGNTTSRWSSAFADPQWLQVDLGRKQDVSQVVLQWQTASAKAYQIQFSDDATTWTTVYSTTTGKGGTETLNVAGSGRYVRMHGTARNTGYGYSLLEFQVFAPGTAGGATPSATSTSANSTPTQAATSGAGVTKVSGSAGNWTLTVDGKPFFVKGVTYGPAQSQAGTYLPDIAAMGANTVRTWGVDDTGTPTLLNAASKNGVKVIVGHWLNQGADYVNDTTYENQVRAEILRRVAANKDNPGVLAWDVGNEVILTMSGSSAAEVEARRVAYAKFVGELAVAIHQVDPNHPVTSTDASTGAWDYYRKYAPALDFYSVNSYNGITGVKGAWSAGGYTKPYLVTEAGPTGEWEVGNDVNGVPNEPTDAQKAAGYTASWKAIADAAGYSLGGTEFNYGTEDDFGGVWLNVNTGGQHRLGYHALRKAFGVTAAANTPPVFSSVSVPAQKSVKAGSTFTIDVAASDPDGDAITYRVGQSSKHVDGSTAIRNSTATQSGAGRFTVTAPAKAGVWKFYVYAGDGRGNVGIETRSVKVVA